MSFGKNDHVMILREIARGMSAAGFNGRYLELGIRKGPCFNACAPFFDEAHAVDIDSNCQKHISGNKNLVWHNCSTKDFFKEYSCSNWRNYSTEENSFDMIFIDAKHECRQGTTDLMHSAFWLKEYGVIVMHDTYPPEEKYAGDHYCGDLWRLHDIFSEGYHAATLPFYFGLTIITKHGGPAWVKKYS